LGCFPKRTVYGSLTTPDPIALHRQLDEITPTASPICVRSVSHGLDQFRLDGVRISAGGFTNLSRDHMDYHPTVAHYLAANCGCSAISFRPVALRDLADHDCSQEVIDAARSKNLRIIAVAATRTAQARVSVWSRPPSKLCTKGLCSNIAARGT